jgi:hypothetical protein
MDHAEYMRTWRERPGNREAQAAASRKHRNNPENAAKILDQKREWKKSAVGRKSVRRQKANWRPKNREKQAAHKAIWKAIRSGELVRPDACGMCGKKCKPHGHHADYTKQLEVVWVCPKCHKELHAQRPA